MWDTIWTHQTTIETWLFGVFVIVVLYWYFFVLYLDCKADKKIKELERQLEDERKKTIFQPDLKEDVDEALKRHREKLDLT